jgi:hypothetical protein
MNLAKVLNICPTNPSRVQFPMAIVLVDRQAMNAEGVPYVSCSELQHSPAFRPQKRRLSELNIAAVTLVSRSSLQKHFH